MSHSENKTYSYDPKGYYAALGVSFDADEHMIKINYRDKAKFWHPDHNISEEALENFQKLSVAYDIVKDDVSRLTYDLLAQAYPAETFPDMFSLKIYKSRKGGEEVSLRALHLRQVIGRLVGYSYTDEQEICSSREAGAAVFQTSLINWFLGWWNPTAFRLCLRAVIDNIRDLDDNRRENFRLLVHNALAYYQEQKFSQAYLSALQAQEFADDYQKKLLRRFMALVNPGPVSRPQPWNYRFLKILQLIIPGLIGGTIIIALSRKVVTETEFMKNFTKSDEITYYQEVKFRTGGETVDDVVVSKILEIPANTEDLNMLYHVTGKVKVMYGPSDDFDVMTELPARKTVRLTGYTPDKVWSRVMIDNGEMGFVRMEKIKKGIGAKIPDDSKIYTGLR